MAGRSGGGGEKVPIAEEQEGERRGMIMSVQFNYYEVVDCLLGL